MTFGGTEAVVEFAGLVTPGLYQLNIIVPEIGPGDRQVVVSVNGVRSLSTPLLMIGGS